MAHFVCNTKTQTFRGTANEVASVAVAWRRQGKQVGAYAIIKKPRRGLVLYLHDDMTYSEDWMSPSDLVSGIQEFRVKIKEFYELRKAEAPA